MSTLDRVGVKAWPESALGLAQARARRQEGYELPGDKRQPPCARRHVNPLMNVVCPNPSSEVQSRKPFLVSSAQLVHAVFGAFRNM